MKHFTEAEAKKMSPLEVQALVCEGLAELCSMFANEADSKEQSEKFRNWVVFGNPSIRALPTPDFGRWAISVDYQRRGAS